MNGIEIDKKNSSNEQKHLKYAIKYLILEKQIVKTSQKKSSNEQKYSSSNEQKTSKKKIVKMCQKKFKWAKKRWHNTLASHI